MKRYHPFKHFSASSRGVARSCATILGLAMILTLVLSACAPAPTPPPAAPTQPPPPTVDVDATVNAVVAATQAAMPTAAMVPTQAPPPTQAPALPTSAPVPTEVSMISYAPSLTGVIWQWISSDKGGQTTAVADPSLYNVEFLADLSVSIKADCNNVFGTYKVDGNKLTITLGPSTLMACPPGSQADMFTQQLGSAASYTFDQVGELLIATSTGEQMKLGPEPIAVLPPPAPGAPSLTSTTNVNVRSGPGTNYVIYGVMQTGKTASLVGRNENSSWWAVEVPLANNAIGWLDARYAQVTGGTNVPVLPAPPPPESVAPPKPAPGDPQAIAVVPAYVRQGPGETYPAYGTAPVGAAAIVLGRSQDSRYWVVRLDPAMVSAGFGWVDGQQVAAQNTSNVPVVQPPLPPTPVQTSCQNVNTNGAYGIATTAVNIRTGPGTNYPAVGTAAQGQCAQIVGRNQDTSWWAFNAPSFGGVLWASASYVNAFNTSTVPVMASPPLPAPLPTPPPPPPGAPLVITTEPLNLRTGPGNQFPSLGMVPAGTVFQVIGQSGVWLNVLVPGVPGGQGWISGNYAVPFTGPIVITPTPPPANPPTQPPAQPTKAPTQAPAEPTKAPTPKPTEAPAPTPKPTEAPQPIQPMATPPTPQVNNSLPTP